MQSRLFKTLGEWSVCSEEKLKEKLTELLGENHDFTNLQKARRLFAAALETPEGLKVQTIHAFCERILSRFPIEAGILPGFEPIDDIDMRRLRDSVRDDVYRAAASEPAGTLNQALQLLAAEKADDGLDTLWKWAAESGGKIEKWEKVGGPAPLQRILGIEYENRTVREIKAQAWEHAPKNEITQAANEMLSSTSKGDVSRAERMLAAFYIQDPVKAFEHYSKVFLTSKEDAPLKSIVTKQSGKFAQQFFSNDPLDGYDSERERILSTLELIKLVSCLESTVAIRTLATEFAARYLTAKHIRRGLDFNDQILLVRDLLKNKAVSDWIRYKLDGGIEHILLDEAQDTSPAQWDIIDALHEAFVQDNPDRPSRFSRTLFAVGDEKQSIYSFQGADPEMFLSKIQDYAGQQNVGEVRMRMSFRSAPEILKFVDQVFVEDGEIQNMFDARSHPVGSDINRHTAHRTDGGRVDLWPLTVKPEKGKEREPWNTAPVDALSKGDAREQLAVDIAKQVKSWLDKREPIEGVAVAGADRLKLKEAVAIKDMLSLAKFVLLPSDDLSLAEVLKSPVFGYSEEDLFEISYGRDVSLWSALKSKRVETTKVLSEIITISHKFAPYEFFARVLDMTDMTGESFLRKIYRRLGLEAKDALEAFLARALAHQRQGAPSLQKFVHNFSQDDQELKRQMDEGKGQVRVMTVHGAKGLEAPVVFLPDTTQFPRRKPDMIPLIETVQPQDRAAYKVFNGYVLPQSKAKTPKALTPFMEAVETAKKQEELRLLYVALTRAESRLVICGFQSGSSNDGMAETCWYKVRLLSVRREPMAAWRKFLKTCIRILKTTPRPYLGGVISWQILKPHRADRLRPLIYLPRRPIATCLCARL